MHSKCTKFSGFILLFQIIKDFSLIAELLYDLVKKGAVFEFGIKQREAFELLKNKLTSQPILSVDSPGDETELHCVASSRGYAALLQRKSDQKFHPIFYFLKRTTEVESRYHSYELETLAIIHAKIPHIFTGYPI